MIVRIFKHFLPLPLVILAVVEVAISFVAVIGAEWMHACGMAWQCSERGNDSMGAELVFLSAAWFAAMMFIGLTATGLYSARQRSRLLGLVMRLVFAVLGTALITVGLFYTVFGARVDREVVWMAAIGTFVALLACRLVLESLGDGLFKRRIVVYGAGQRAATIAQLRRRADRRGFTLVGYIPAEGDRKYAVPAQQCLTMDKDKSLLELCIRHDVDEIVVAMDDRRSRFPMHDLLECRLDGIEVTELVSFFERETGKLRLDMMNPSWMIFSDGFRHSRLHAVMERVFDVVASFVLLLFAAPLMFLTVIAIKIEDGLRAPVLYGQVRVGRRDRLFRLLKFRSMRTDAEKSGAVWAMKNDPRVTRVGLFIRKARIDELPQLLCVLRGEMSFVGPRPERPEFVSQLNERIPYYRERHAIKPGITGWAQLCYPYGSSEHDALEKLQYDLFYVKNHSLLFYLAVLVQTVEVIVWGKGAR